MRLDADKDSRSFLEELEADSSLLEPGQLRRRIDVLDLLDATFGGTDFDGFGRDSGEAWTHHRAKAMRARLEAVNAELYQSLRLAIRRGIEPSGLFRWIQTAESSDEPVDPAPGLGYDFRDEFVSGILQLQEPSRAEASRGHEMVFYQPTPVRHILHFIAASGLCEADVLVDLGAGLGHVVLLASMLTGARGVGIEVEAAYVRSARECALSLGLSRATFLQQDAREADLSGGSVFYLYSPFTGTILADVLERLRREGADRRIKVCTLGPCTSVVAKEPWLKASAPWDAERITLFESQTPYP
ncbi:MAG TPA: class I SAM-dependent methyltransferase [Edaphobacter sp.]